ncbi:MAG: glycoside hydrolase family 2 TIM barrel-domain containing protein [Bacteroidales bacterium]|nr:glycoside hydrolase family 2 TIM barrel-domain containing protein [Bacteroidales bacterium]
MNKISHIIRGGISYFAGMILFISCEKQTGIEFPRRISFDAGWKFHYGEISNPFDPVNDQVDWRNMDLPHDWSIELPFSKESTGGTATGYTVGGTGWYKKNFVLQPEQAGRKLSLYFEGAYMETEIWLNGQKAGYHPYGYTSFFVDITALCNPPGIENTLAVKVSNNEKNSRWYSGSGIYRHIWLETTDLLHLDTWGVYITTPEVTMEIAMVSISTDIINETNGSVRARVDFRISQSGSDRTISQSAEISLNPGEEKTLVQPIEILKHDLWSVDSPALYTADIEIRTGSTMRDRISTTFGIRSISFRAEDGFLLNGQPLELKGGCMHHDNGLLGAAAIDRAEERKVELLKANGFNAVRCAHNPPSEKFLEACDRLGLLVIDEAFDQWHQPKNPDDYHRFFDEWNEQDFTSMLLRDRNHPSIIMWSIGNEIQERADTSGLRIIRKFRRLIDRYDPTRHMTLAVNDFWDKPGYTWKDSERTFEQLDVGGYNYLWWVYEEDHRQFPDRVIFGSESTPMERAVNWKLVEEHPYVVGDFVWTAMDYLGETGIGHTSYVKKLTKGPHQLLEWPCFNAWCGDIDLCGNKKPQSALRDILWNESSLEMLVHAPLPAGMVEKVSYWGWPDELASWNWKGLEGKIMDVRVFTRYPSVRLYLNGNLIGEKEILKDDPADPVAWFLVPYEPGVLKAVGMEKGNGRDTVLLVTTGPPAGIVLKADQVMLSNSRNDLSFVQIELVDQNGNRVQDDDRKITLSLSGAGEITAAGNASPTDMESFRSMDPRTFRGRALAIIRPTGEDGTILFHARSDGLPEETLTIQVHN